MQVWSKSIHSFMRHGADKPFFNNLSLCATLKMGSWSPKSNQFFSMSQQYRCTSQNPSICSGDRVQTGHFPTIWAPCDLENGVKVTKSNQFLSLSQQYSCTSLVKIHPFILEIGYRKAIFQQSEPSCDLKYGIKVTKIWSVLFHVTTI